MYRSVIFTFFSSKSLNVTTFRYVRNPSLRRNNVKQLKATVKTVRNSYNNELSNLSNFEDFVKTAKIYNKCSEEDIDLALTNDNMDDIISPKTAYRKMTEEKSFIQKQIIKKKYFDLEKETNLLTHAAKEQIRYLHKLNPTEWTPETLADFFPMSVTGAKKLLKSNYELRTPKKIQEHDEEVQKRWDSLLAGKPLPEITHLTKRLWYEGKLSIEHFQGNSNLPNPPETCAKIIKEEKVPATGEFFAIIEQYVNYKNAKKDELNERKDEKSLEINKVLKKTNFKGKENVLNKNKYFSDDTINEYKYKNNSSRHARNTTFNEPDVLHSQFEANLKEEISLPKQKDQEEYAKWLEAKESESPSISTPSKKFIKISKYMKKII